MRSELNRIRGFAIVSAIFILVVLAALGAFIVNISTSQQIGSAIDVQGVRAYQAARAGIEWGLYQVQSTATYKFGYISINPNTRACPAPTTSFSPAAPTLSGFAVTVVCSAQPDLLSGTITTSAAVATVAGAGTKFTTELSVGQSFCITDGTSIGTVLSITNDTNLTLTANAALTTVAVPYTRCGPTIFSLTSTACNQPIVGWGPATTACPNATPGNLYIERRLSVAF